MIDHPALDQLPQLRQLWKMAFGDEDSFMDCFFENGFAPERCACLLDKGSIIAALYWFDVTVEDQKAAYIYGVATHPDYRGQGLCRRLMETTHRSLAEQGYKSILLVPQTETLRDMYRKMGYRDCTKRGEFFCSDDPYPVPMHAITAQEYAFLRRSYLPRGSVIQEGDNLHFLGSYTRFYKGMDFLMAASIENESLFAPEFLGNPASAPGTLCALGCSQGTFRAPGEKLDFAMFCPLAEDAAVPTYFAFAFD